MSENIEPNEPKREKDSIEFVSAVTPDKDPFVYEGERYDDLKFVWLSKATINSLTNKNVVDIPDEGVVFIGPQDFMDHWQIVSENLGGSLTREEIRKINVVDAGMISRSDETTVLVPSVSYSGELRTEDGEMARMSSEKVRQLHQRTADHLTETFKDSDTPYDFISP